jgi:hypothetical protein
MTVLALLALGLSACGGSGNDAFVPPTGGGTGATVGTITVTSSVATIPSDSSAAATITAHATDASNSAVSGASIAFSTSAGTISGSPATTDANGNASVTLTAGTAAANTTITVTAASGTASGKTTVTVANTKQTVAVETSLPQIPSDDSKPATITALVRDASNNAVSGATVHFVASSGLLTITSGTTNASGAATASLSAANDPTNRNITVTASVGSTTATIAVPVVGTTLTLSGPASLVQGAIGTYSVTLADSGKNPITGTAVTLVSPGNTVAPASIMTDSSGTGTFQLTAAKSGADTVTATALGQSASQGLSVSNQSFAFTTPAEGVLAPVSTAVPPAPANNPLTIAVHWTSGGVAVVGQTVAFSSTRGTMSAATATTDPSGNATVMITSNTAGPAIIAASATGVSAQRDVTFIATTPTQIDVQASPATIATTGQSTITAIVRDAAGNLVDNQTVAFQLTDVTGGSLSVATVVTNTSGIAQTVYTASNTPSTSNGVMVKATVQATGLNKTATLTVGGQTVFLSLGTGAVISENAAKTQFQMPWVVQAVDSSGNPVNNVTVTLAIHSALRSDGFSAYGKGSYEICGSGWVQYNTTATCPANGPVACDNEDLLLTGVYEAGEDTNNNGKLDPGDVAVATPGTVITASDGSSGFLVEYPEDHALWVQTTLTATATVQGTQSSTEATFILPMLAVYLSTTASEPPGFKSPYGIANSCTIAN